MKEVKPGEWYLGVICKKCKMPILLFHDPSKGKIDFKGPGKLKVTCPNQKCHHENLYGTDEVQKFRAEQVH